MAKKSAAKKRPARRPGPTRKAAGGRRTGKPGRKTARARAGVKSSRQAASPARKKKKVRTGPKKKAARRTTASRRTTPKTSPKASKKKASKKQASKKSGARKKPGGTGPSTRLRAGLERTLAQTPAAGRTVKGRTNPRPTRRSTGTPAGAGSTRRAPSLDRERRRLRELDETLPGPPSSLDTRDRMASAARTGRAEMLQDRREHTESSPVLTGGDVDANWQGAYAVGDEAPGGDNPTPDQDRVDDIGKALGVTYEDNEELKGADKIAERDKHRWELDPASAEDYRTRDKDLKEE
jgi:hypothetical protein